MSQPSPDARAVVRAIDALSAQVRRIADALSTTTDAPSGYQPTGVRPEPTTAPDTPSPLAADRATDDAPTTPDDGRPVPLATPCAACGHPYNWHDRPGWCEFKDDENRHCGCAEFVPGEKPQPVDPWRVLGAWAPAAPCEQHPNAPVIGGICGGCTQYPADMRPAPAADEDALRTTRRDSLLVLLSRAGRGVLKPDEGALLRQHVEAEIRDADTARAVAAGNKRHVRMLVPEIDRLTAELEDAEQRADGFRTELEQAQAAIERVRAAIADRPVLLVDGQPASHYEAGLSDAFLVVTRALDGTEHPTTTKEN
ncbi:hypothetical protein AB0A91_16305 [Streptomyces sp. NPDC042207]|uniref:hypothetical protein n=1 Tax=Streptomyces sp. NPDC042207 TaxID=3154331 RepID=UPI003402DE6A